MRSPSSRSSAWMKEARSISHALARAFPAPELLAPASAGIDISDSSIKWIVLTPQAGTHRIRSYGDLSLDAGIVSGGVIRDVEALAAALKKVKDELRGVACAHAALPEEAGYVFGMTVPVETKREQILRMIEFEFEDRVPIPPSAAVYDYSVIPTSTAAAATEISVTVFPRDIAEAYEAAFEKAGITLLSLEIEARSIARAVSSDEPDEPITLLVDFGRARTGFALVKSGYPIFTSTVEVGGDQMTKAIMQSLGVDEAHAELVKNEQGLSVVKDAKGVEAVSGTASALADEVARHYHYWDTRRNDRGERMTPVGKVVLVGGSANLKGLPEYIAGRVQATAEIGNIWQNVATFAEYIPPIDQRQSLQYATAVGLALRGI